MLARLLPFTLLVATAASGQALFFEQLPASQRVGGRSGAVTVERRSGATPITSGNTQVTISADSPLAQVAAAPEPWAAWGPTLQLAIPPGSSRTPPFYVRDGRPGLTSWLASASGFTAADAGLVVRTDAVTCDVETGTVLDTDAPPGCFNTRYAPYPVSTIGAAAGAAHRGSFGVLLVDAENGNGDAADTALYEDGAPIFGDYYSRSWVRVTSGNARGDILLGQLTNAQATSPSVLDVRVNTSTSALSLGGFEADAGYRSTQSDAGFSFGAWRLLEWAALGVGLADGGRRLWLDGQLVIEDRHVDFSGGRLAVARLAIGQPYTQDRRWLGTIDFDDIRSAVVPLASALRLGPATPAAVGDCVPLDVELVASATGAPTAGPEPFDVTLDAGAPLYVDGTCGTPGSVVRFGQGETRRTVSLRPAQVTETVQAGTIDFLGSQRSYAFQPRPDAGAPDAGVEDAGLPDAGGPDAGVEDGGLSDAGLDDAGAFDAGPTDAGPSPDAGAPEPRALAVGCGCSSVSAPVLLGLALALWRRRRLAPGSRARGA